MEQLFESPSLLPSSLSQYTHGTTESLHVWKLSRTVHSHPLKVTFKNWAHLTYCGVCQSGGASTSCLPGGQEWSLQHGCYQEWSEWSSLIRYDQNHPLNIYLISIKFSLKIEPYELPHPQTRCLRCSPLTADVDDPWERWALKEALYREESGLTWK